MRFPLAGCKPGVGSNGGGHRMAQVQNLRVYLS